MSRNGATRRHPEYHPFVHNQEIQMFRTHQPAQETESAVPESARLLTPRGALILLLAVLVGIGAGVLAAMAGRHPAEAVLAGVAASAAAVMFFDRLVDHG
ncbi:hypothetical protein [Saccharothrix lopnurensis]|uniref:Uncharacterized protein n=1 Tax=Saccharothrix lopnurensis TaxID=1670621 RepID=A0ABW1PFY7_9PSEU